MKRFLFSFFTSFVMAAFSLMVNPLMAASNALHFDGVNDYVDIPDLPASINFSQGFSFSAWVKWDAFQGNERIFEIGNGNEDIDNSIILRTVEGTGKLMLQSSAPSYNQKKYQLYIL